LEGDSRLAPSPPSEWPAPPHSLPQPPLQGKVPATSSVGCFYCKACAGRSSAGCVYYEACAGHFICWLFAARPVPVVHRPAVYYEACAGHFICRLFATTALFCLAMPCLPSFGLAPWLWPLFCFSSPPPPPLFITMCARIITQVARTALLAATTRDCTGSPCTAFVH